MKVNKYKNTRTEYNGFKYASAKEARYAQNLDILKKAQGNTKVLSYVQQMPFVIEVKGIRICKYLLDFMVSYPDRIEYIDVKGMRTPVYKIKKKLVEAQFGIEIKEV